MKAGDELEPVVAVVAHDGRDKDALQLDRVGERLHVRVVERPHVLGNADPIERDLALAPDVHERVARRFEGLTPVLDVGCGEGELARHLPAGAWVGVDASAEMLAGAPEPHHRADATALPFPDESFGSVALLYVLYHLLDPTLALTEARRVLKPGGLVAVAAPSRHDSPEVAHVLPRGGLTFDAELAPRAPPPVL
jgi:SAM-dependent methyltransferase